MNPGCLTIARINSGLNCYHLHRVIYERLEVLLLNPAIKNVPQGEHMLAIVLHKSYIM